jgi:CheY-like chemotaxis protein
MASIASGELINRRKSQSDSSSGIVRSRKAGCLPMDAIYKSYNSANGADDGKDEGAETAAETILVAEDDFLVSTSMKKCLEGAGYRIILASDGEEALDIFRRRHNEISVIISDVIMPRMTGVEFLEEARKVKQGIGVLFASGYSAGFLKDRGILLEGMELISKPFSKQELIRRVKELLESE